MRNLLILLVLISTCVGIGCVIDDRIAIDYYKVGDRVQVKDMNPECTTMIIKYIPINQYVISVKCKTSPTVPWPNRTIYEGDIVKRL